MTKKGKRSGSRVRRYMRLEGSTLSNHHTADGAPTWSVSVRDALITVNARRCRITIELHQHQLHLFVDTPAEADAWYEALTDAKSRALFVSSPASSLSPTPYAELLTAATSNDSALSNGGGCACCASESSCHCSKGGATKGMTPSTSLVARFRQKINDLHLHHAHHYESQQQRGGEGRENNGKSGDHCQLLSNRLAADQGRQPGCYSQTPCCCSRPSHDKENCSSIPSNASHHAPINGAVNHPHCACSRKYLQPGTAFKFSAPSVHVVERKRAKPQHMVASQKQICIDGIDVSVATAVAAVDACETRSSASATTESSSTTITTTSTTGITTDKKADAMRRFANGFKVVKPPRENVSDDRTAGKRFHRPLLLADLSKGDDDDSSSDDDDVIPLSECLEAPMYEETPASMIFKRFKLP